MRKILLLTIVAIGLVSIFRLIPAPSKVDSSSRVEAGAAPNFDTKHIKITVGKITVSHANAGQGRVSKTFLFAPGTQRAIYSLEAGIHNVQTGKYDHAASYTGSGGGVCYSTIVYK